MEKYIIVKDQTKIVRRFNLRGRTLEFKFRELPPKTEPVRWVKDAIGDVITRATKDLSPSDQVAFNFGCKDLSRGDGWFRFKTAAEVTLDDVWDVISKIYQSNSTGLNTETFCLGVTTVKMPVGRGRGKNYNTFEEECSKRGGIIAIKNSDNLCLPRALVIAKAYVDRDPERTKVRRDIGKLQTLRARQLADGVEIPKEGCGIPELHIFQNLLSEYRIVVYKYGVKGKDLIFSGDGGTKNLNLIFHKGHYNVITSLTAAFSTTYFCESCSTSHDHKNNHRCGKSCFACQRSPPCEDGIRVKCTNCLRTFKNQLCYNNHIEIGTMGSVCTQIRRCSECLKTVKAEREHTCGETFCKICHQHQPSGHLCFMQLNGGKPKTKDILYIFYDLETRQEKQLEDGSFEHEPNLCVFKQCCDTCIDSADIICKKCGLRLQKIGGKLPISSFMIHLFQIRKKFKKIVVIAHNGQAFDHQFILKHILEETDLSPELIMRGTKIVLMILKNIVFLDSLNYFPMPLSTLPKAFDFASKKGYFPHLFNTLDNQKYDGPLPPIEYYSPNTMKDDARDEFLKWYEEHKHDRFNFQKEIVDYCVSDVEILTEACLKFRKQMITTTNVCPFTEACTIASACNKVFRRNFLKPNTIGIIPKGGYRLTDNCSIIALKWLVWEENKRNIDIQHAGNGKETVLHGVKVDGFSSETNEVFEFHGCYWHGCPSCFKYQRDKPTLDDSTQTMDFRFESTVAKIDRLKSAGYEVVEKWECEFRAEIAKNSEIKNYVENHPILSLAPLNPRDAFYGGRTGNCRTYYKACNEEKIKYLDVCSLYPWVCKYGKYPIGHPEVLVGEQCNTINLQDTDGVIKCTVLPPQNLYHPVLPVKMNSKLMFILCRTCGENMLVEECHHTEEDRSITGTWIIDEVVKAVEMGYVMLNISEIWKYKVEQYDVDRKTGGLFVEMMNKFIKIKQEASGWPSECKTPEQKDKYIEDFFNREGVRLEFQNILKNSGLRCLSKLMLNSFWGKLGQQENQTKTKIIHTPEEFFNMLTNPAIHVNSCLPINEDVLLVNYSLIEESYEPISTVNVCMAAYTTTKARLKLYSYLEKLGERVLYYDTDSVVFSHKEGEWEPPIGEFIGDMTDELEVYGQGSSISEFVSGGPKNYAYKIYSTDTKEEMVVCKVKGICLNYSTSLEVNFESIKDMILNDSPPIKIISHNIRRTREHQVVTKKEVKMYRPNSLKRMFFSDHSSLPYGYKRMRKEW